MLLIDAVRSSDQNAADISVRVECTIHRGGEDGRFADVPWLRLDQAVARVAANGSQIFVARITAPTDAGAEELDVTGVLNAEHTELARFGKPVLLRVQPSRPWTVTATVTEVVLPWDQWTDLGFEVTGPANAPTILHVVAAPDDRDGLGTTVVPQKFPLAVRDTGGVRVLPASGSATFTVGLNPGGTTYPLIGELA